MPTADTFGLKREASIIESGVRDVFTPHKPVDEIELLFGREAEVKKIIEQLNTPGQHCLLYGERGVGKSSLANIATRLLLTILVNDKLIIKRCDESDTFETILEKTLQEVGFETHRISYKESKSSGASGGINLQLISAQADGSETTTEEFRASDISPSKAVELIADYRGLLYVDEVDSIAFTEKKKLSQFIKLLSDASSKLKLLVVGVAETSQELTAGHTSVQRCLKENYISRMSQKDLESIIVKGSTQLGLQFTPEVIKRIVEVSAGYPYFTHLLALKCAEEAIGSKKKIINEDTLALAVKSSISDAEGSLRRQYFSATHSVNTDMYEKILLSAAQIGKPMFKASELRGSLSKMEKRAIVQGELNNYLKRLVSESSETILRREAKGIYRFNDPRMPSYVQIAQNSV